MSTQSRTSLRATALSALSGLWVVVVPAAAWLIMGPNVNRAVRYAAQTLPNFGLTVLLGWWVFGKWFENRVA